MKNKLIIYTDKLTADIIMEVRKSYGLADKTIIRTIEDITTIEPEIYQSMCKIKEASWFEDFRYYHNATSNQPLYSYLMLLKTWFLKDAVENNLVYTGFVAWFDFGFNHGGKVFTHPEDFDFEWKYDFSKKIHLYSLGKVDEKPIFEIVRRQCDSIMGCSYITPTEDVTSLWELTKSAMQTLIKVGLFDDDQLLLLMAYRERPELFEVVTSSWFLPLKEYGGSHLRVKAEKTFPWWKKIILRTMEKYDKHKKVRNYYRITKNNLLNK